MYTGEYQYKCLYHLAEICKIYNNQIIASRVICKLTWLILLEIETPVFFPQIH